MQSNDTPGRRVESGCVWPGVAGSSQRSLGEGALIILHSHWLVDPHCVNKLIVRVKAPPTGRITSRGSALSGILQTMQCELELAVWG